MSEKPAAIAVPPPSCNPRQSEGVRIVKSKRPLSHGPTYEGSTSVSAVQTLPIALRIELVAKFEKQIVLGKPFPKVLSGKI